MMLSQFFEVLMTFTVTKPEKAILNLSSIISLLTSEQKCHYA